MDAKLIKIFILQEFCKLLLKKNMQNRIKREKRYEFDNVILIMTLEL